MLPDWEGVSGFASQEYIKEGPVLEVLFLATHQSFREGGYARDLVRSLEHSAREMGCSAVVVAAVPAQGINFWTRAGYRVEVPLLELEEDDKPQGGPGLSAPTTALGEFLHEHMVLFTDSPLVVKLLRDVSVSQDVEAGCCTADDSNVDLTNDKDIRDAAFLSMD